MDDIDNGFLALLPFDSSETLGPVGLTRRVDTASSVPSQVLHQIIRDVVAERRASVTIRIEVCRSLLRTNETSER